MKGYGNGIISDKSRKMLENCTSLKTMIRKLNNISKSAYDDAPVRQERRAFQEVSCDAKELQMVAKAVMQRRGIKATAIKGTSEGKESCCKKPKPNDSTDIIGVSGFPHFSYNTKIFVRAGVFFGLGLDKWGHSAKNSKLRIARVEKCFRLRDGGQHWVSMRVFDKVMVPPRKRPGQAPIPEEVKNLHLPFLTATKEIEIVEACDLNMPLHVLDAHCSELGFVSGHGAQQVYVLNTYHPGSGFFGS